MVDVSSKQPTRRTATASAFVELSAAVLAALPSNPKGNPLEVARFAGIQAAKRTADLIPMCHPLALTHVDVEATSSRGGVRITSIGVHNRTHRRRNGSAHRCRGCRAHRLRHDQGTRQGHRHSRNSPRIEIRRQKREFCAEREKAELAALAGFAELEKVTSVLRLDLRPHCHPHRFHSRLEKAGPSLAPHRAEVVKWQTHQP